MSDPQTESDGIFTIRNVLSPLDANRPPPTKQKQEKFFPIPKGDSVYAQAKRAEYIEKDLFKAETLYKKAIKSGERSASAAKDLAGVLHQKGKTLEAVEMLKENSHLFTQDRRKYENLLTNLRKQASPAASCLNRILRIKGITKEDNTESVNSMFKNPRRILSIQWYEDYAQLSFASHSAARKTLETFIPTETYTIDWMPTQQSEPTRSLEKRVPFETVMFFRENTTSTRCLPVDQAEADQKKVEEIDDDVAVKLLG